MTVGDALIFSMGALVGASVEITGNLNNLCFADINAIITAAYYVIFFLIEYDETQNPLTLSWSIFYLFKTLETSYNV